MATNSNMFTDNETNNWIKAYLALNITKEGLVNFLNTELLKFHSAVGISCGNCSIEQLIPCPTPPYCTKSKLNCRFHTSQKPQKCSACEQVKQNIILNHRFSSPSWRNTDAKKWASDCWEIGKCFLPPDGYSSVSSIQESDFNGVISIMLNCTHFQNSLSSLCLSPPPPDKQSPLETVRQIGRDVRHTSDCKVRDADLQGYFQRMHKLLADPKCLQHDHAARVARTRLSNNDCMSLKELGALLQEAHHILKHAKEAGERVNKEAERTLAEVLQRLEITMRAGEQRLYSKMKVGERRLKSATKYGKRRLQYQTQVGEQRIKRITKKEGRRFKSKTKVCEQRLRSTINVGKQCLIRATIVGEQHLQSNTQVGEQRLQMMTKVGEQRIESRKQDVEQYIERKIQDGTQRIECNVQNGIVRIQNAANKPAREDYERGVADLRQRLMNYYDDKTCNVPLSTFDHSRDKRISDVYVTPKIHRIQIEKDGTRVKKEQRVSTYKEIFYTNDKPNHRIYIQGEPGRGKSTFAVKLVHDWCNENQPTSVASIRNPAFEDWLTIRKFKFLFFISLGDSMDQTDVTQIIKKQLIDKTFSEDERGDVYKLFVQIMKSEICLVVREGLDEWVSPSGSNLAEPSMAGFSKDTCTVLTTSRPWKLSDERIKNSQIDSLFEIEGISDPYSFSKNIIRCLIDHTKDLEETVAKFNVFVNRPNLPSLSSSPMLYALVICTWVDTMEAGENLKGSSLCALYTILLECLCKKANSATGYFNDSNPPQIHCFSRTRYLQPNIENLNMLAEVACKLMFSSERQSSFVFDEKTLSHFFPQEDITVLKNFALKTGILTNRKDKSQTRSYYSFVHKTVQEFLAAYYIARNPHFIDDFSSKYHACKDFSYFDTSQVFIFLCGINICVANELSTLLNRCAIAGGDWWSYNACQYIIESGLREAAANEQDGIRLELSHFYIHTRNIRDLYSTWSTNKSNVLFLYVSSSEIETLQFSSARDEPSSHFELNLSTCNKLKRMDLYGKGIRLRDIASAATSETPVWIDQVLCTGSPPVLPSIERIKLQDVTCSSKWLHSLFSTLLTRDKEVVCELKLCDITSSAEGAVSGSSTYIEEAIIQTTKNTLNMHIKQNDNTGLWEALRGLNIESLSLSQSILTHLESFSQSLSSLTRLKYLSIKVDECPDVWEALCSLNIKSLKVRQRILNPTVQSLSHSLSSLTQLESLSIKVHKCPSLLKALRGLTIKSLTLTCWVDCLKANDAESLSQSLSSLTKLESLSINVMIFSHAFLETLRGLNIKSLTLIWTMYYLKVNHVESSSQSLKSLKKLETLSIKVYEDPVLWEIFHGLNITSLTLTYYEDCLEVNNIKSLSQSLSSLKQLQTLTIYMRIFINIQLPQSLKYLNIYCTSLLPSELRELKDTLSACTQTVETNVEFAAYDDFRLEAIQLEDYIAIKQELETLKTVAVKRFRIFDKINKNNYMWNDDAKAWSVRDIGGVDKDDQDIENVTNPQNKKFIKRINDHSINRISMRLIINPNSI